MGVESFLHSIRELYGKVNANVFRTAQGNMNTHHMAFMRQLQKEMRVERALTIPLHKLSVVIFDIETTGFFPDKGDQIISIGAVKVDGGEIREDQQFYSLIRYEDVLSEEISELTGIKDEELKAAPLLSEVLIKFFEFVKDDTLVAHHASHEKSFMQSVCWKQFRTPFKHRIVDTSFLFKITDPDVNLVTLDDCCQYNEIPIINRHNALGDAIMTAHIWCSHLKKIQQLGCNTLQDVYERLAK